MADEVLRAKERPRGRTRDSFLSFGLAEMLLYQRVQKIAVRPKIDWLLVRVNANGGKNG